MSRTILLVVVTLFTVFDTVHNKGNNVTVNIVQGSLRGSMKTSYKLHNYHSFTGIRYGKPPVGKLRFKLPEPADKWEGVFDATKEVQCIHHEFGVHERTKGQEDCLALNVYTRSIPEVSDKGPGPKLPVMVWIHGGGFQFGSGTTETYGPDFFMDEDVVIVTINYRLGPLGFLSTGDDNIPGNMGMWDQVLALKWVQQNIAAFGGDPDNVTIFGESAGGMSVSYLLLSKAASGLFHKAIVQSGPPISHFCKSEKHPAYHARSLAATLGCDPEGSTAAITACLNKLDGATLNKPLFKESDFEIWRKHFKPVVDDYASKPFMPREPLVMIEEGEFNKVPLIVGSNRHEGQMFMLMNPNLQEDLRNRFFEYIPNTLLYRDTDSHDEGTNRFAQMVKKEIFGGRAPDLETDDMYTMIYLYGDTFANYASTKFARMVAEKTDKPVFEYRYHHVGSVTFTDFMKATLGTKQLVTMVIKAVARIIGRFFGMDFFSNSEWVCHADELFVMWKASIIPFDTVYTEKDKRVSAAMIQMWTNFAKHGDPTPQDEITPGDKWIPVTGGQESKHLDISADGPELKSDSVQYIKRGEFWERVYEEHPPLIHYKKSPTFKNTKLYNKKLQAQYKEEL